VLQNLQCNFLTVGLHFYNAMSNMAHDVRLAIRDKMRLCQAYSHLKPTMCLSKNSYAHTCYIHAYWLVITSLLRITFLSKLRMWSHEHPIRAKKHVFTNRGCT
jgi:hypothetical protein